MVLHDMVYLSHRKVEEKVGKRSNHMDYEFLIIQEKEKIHISNNLISHIHFLISYFFSDCDRKGRKGIGKKKVKQGIVSLLH
jgi:hypothetical protein